MAVKIDMNAYIQSGKIVVSKSMARNMLTTETEKGYQFEWKLFTQTRLLLTC